MGLAVVESLGCETAVDLVNFLSYSLEEADELGGSIGSHFFELDLQLVDLV